MRTPSLARLRKLLLKMPVSQRRAIIRRATFKLIRGEQSNIESTVNVTATLKRAGFTVIESGVDVMPSVRRRAVRESLA